MFEIIKEYLIDEALVVIPVLLILGKIIKETPKMKDWVIPYVLLVLGIAFSVSLIGFSVDGVIQGILVTGSAVLVHQGYKQAKNKGDDQ